MALVLDTSISLSWLLHDELGQQYAIADRVLGHLESNPEAALAVPDLWWLEWSNAVLRAQGDSLVTPVQIADYAELIAGLEIETTFISPEDVLTRILPLAIRTGLSTYDASYLDLAIELKAPLATTNQALRRAAMAHRVEIF